MVDFLLPVSDRRLWRFGRLNILSQQTHVMCLLRNLGSSKNKKINKLHHWNNGNFIISSLSLQQQHSAGERSEKWVKTIPFFFLVLAFVDLYAIISLWGLSTKGVSWSYSWTSLNKVLGKSGEVPADWKLGNIIPIYKKSLRKDPGNYRPVMV